MIELKLQLIEYRGAERGYAIGHYARWLNKGAKRIEATSSDPLIQISAFKDDATNKFTVVAINNSTVNTTVQFNFSALNLTGPINGEQSYNTTRWQAITPVTPTANQFTYTLTHKSVTTFSGNYSTPVGINNISANNQFHIYPNPAQQTFTVELSQENFDLIISDLTGRKIYEQKNISGKTQIDSRSFISGIYFVQATNGKNILNKKLIINK